MRSMSPRTPITHTDLRISRSKDEFEQEADRIAAQVTSMPGPPAAAVPDAGIVQRKHAHRKDEEEENTPLMPSPKDLHKDLHSAEESHSLEAPPIVHEVVRSPGQPLDAPTRAFFEPRFGHDFSKVRVHADRTATQAARAVSAQAFTYGRHLVFDENSYRPAMQTGRRLLAHELTHTLQQNAGTFAIQRQRQAVDIAAVAAEVEALVRPGNDEAGALNRLKSLDMEDLLKVVEKLYDDADSTDPDEGRRRSFGLLNSDLDPPVAGTSQNPALQGLTERDRARLKSAFDAAPARKLRNPKEDDPGTSPTVSGYRDRSKTSGPARTGDWGEDPGGNTWVAHADPVQGIRTNFATNIPSKLRSSAWLGNNPSNADYVPTLTKRAIGSFHWGTGIHHFAIYFSVADAAADLRERVQQFQTIGSYVRAHLGKNPKDKNNFADYITNMQKVVAVTENDPTSAWTADDTRWASLVEGFKSAEGWREGNTITAANVKTISTNPTDAPIIAYYQNLLGSTPSGT
jgi:hypothetical protein